MLARPAGAVPRTTLQQTQIFKSCSSVCVGVQIGHSLIWLLSEGQAIHSLWKKLLKRCTRWTPCLRGTSHLVETGQGSNEAQSRQTVDTHVRGQSSERNLAGLPSNTQCKYPTCSTPSLPDLLHKANFTVTCCSSRIRWFPFYNTNFNGNYQQTQRLLNVSFVCSWQ